MSVFSKLHTINTFIFDIDGVFTNSEMLVMENGDLLRTMSARDGYVLKLAVSKGYNIIVITGGSSNGVTLRLQRLGIHHIYTGITDKVTVLNEHVRKHNLDLSTSVYMGDDIPDIAPMMVCGMKACPKDAVPEVVAISDFIASKDGGQHCVRELVEKILKLRGDWDVSHDYHSAQST